MDFRYTPHEQQFRLEVRRFIAEHCPCELKGFHEIHAEHVPLEMAFLKRMAAKGWLGAAFPQEYGGLGGERPMAEYILIDELHHATGRRGGHHFHRLHHRQHAAGSDRRS
jgi:alkylation response protein AidB-like acyl-CoA dehydrogenase